MSSTPHKIVDSFVRLTPRCLDTLITQYAGTERPTVWTGLFLVPRAGSDPVRSGQLNGLGTFALHGPGCSFELHAGEALCVDWDDDGRAVIGSWRIRMFAESIGDQLINVEALGAAAGQTSSIIQIALDQFTWPLRRYDLTWKDT